MDLEAYVDVVPWLVFMVVDRHSGLGLSWASLSGAVCGGGVAAWSQVRHRQTPVGWVAVVTFGGLAVVGLVANQPTMWFEPAMRSASIAVLAGVALLSLRRRPLSEAYTGDRVPPACRAEPAFAAVNRRITAAWAMAAVLVALSFAADAFVSSSVALTMCDWVLPIVVVACVVRWAAVQWTAYLAWTENPAQPGDAPLGSLTVEREPASSSSRTTPGTITYLHGARAGH